MSLDFFGEGLLWGGWWDSTGGQDARPGLCLAMGHWDGMVPLRDSPVADPKDPFSEGGVGWGWPHSVKGVIPEARKGPKGRGCLA